MDARFEEKCETINRYMTKKMQNSSGKCHVSDCPLKRSDNGAVETYAKQNESYDSLVAAFLGYQHTLHCCRHEFTERLMLFEWVLLCPNTDKFSHPVLRDEMNSLSN